MISVGFILYRGQEVQVLLASVFFAAVCYIDTLKAKIPNTANASLAIAGLALNFSTAGGKGLTLSALGIVTGMGLLFIPYLLGGFGAGDVKALAALGSLVGPQPILQIFVYMALSGGVLAILHYLCDRNLKGKTVQWWTALKAVKATGDPHLLTAQNQEPLRFPYAAAIALGYYIWLIRGDVL